MTILEMLGKNLSPRGPGDGGDSVYLDFARGSAAERPNQAVERTATRLISMGRVATLSFIFSTLAPGCRRSSCSR